MTNFRISFFNLLNWCKCSRKNSVSLFHAMLLLVAAFHIQCSAPTTQSVHRWDLELLPNTGISIRQNPAGVARISLPCLRQTLHLSFVWVLLLSGLVPVFGATRWPTPHTGSTCGSIHDPTRHGAGGNNPSVQGLWLSFQLQWYLIKSFYTELSFLHWKPDTPLKLRGKWESSNCSTNKTSQ